MKKVILSLIILGLVILLAVFAMRGRVSAPGEKLVGASETQVMSIEDYVRKNISELSPIKESLGGKFYVTSIEAHGGSGTVSYEDGHSAFIADFTYSVDESGAPGIDSFELRK